MKIMGEKSHRAAMSPPLPSDNALQAQRGTEAMDPFHWPSQFRTLGPFLLMCLDGQDAVFMFFSCASTWHELMLSARSSDPRAEYSAGAPGSAAAFKNILGKKGNLLCVP